MRTLLTALALIAAPLSAQAQTATPATVEAPIATEARAFMASYAVDLLAGNREALIARYDRSGVYFPMDGPGMTPIEDVAKIYRGDGWQPPASFEWQGLVFKPMNADAILVTGAFLWGRADGKKRHISYTGLFVRQDGVLRIQIEHESAINP